MPSVSIAENTNVQFFSHLEENGTVPVAVFVGATAGIGQEMIRALHRYTKGRCHIIVVGRNEEKTRKTFAELDKKVDPEQEWKREFVYCDVSLFKNVRDACSKLLASLPKINFLVLSAGIMPLLWSKDRDETEEGHSRQLVFRYYYRMAFIHHLLPLLRNAKDLGEPARVTSIQGTMLSFAVPKDDLGLKRPGNYSGWKAWKLAIVYGDYMIQSFALQNPGISFTTANPEMVNTGQLQEASRTLVPVPLLHYLVFLIFWLTSKKVEDSAVWMWYNVADGKEGGKDGAEGWYRRSGTGRNLGNTFFKRDEDERKRVYEHTMEVIGM